MGRQLAWRLLLGACGAAAKSKSFMDKEGILWQSPGALSREDIDAAEAMISHTRAHGPRHHVNTTRNFGDSSMYNSGHVVTYLHMFKDDPAWAPLVGRLRALAIRADEDAQWGIAAHVDVGRMNLRCLELIEYFRTPSATGPFPASRGYDDSLGWHFDGNTLFTVAVSLSEPGKDFEGGGFQIRRRTQHPEEHWAGAGGATIWRGWEEHRVRDMLSGVRRVLVAEWWTGAPASLHVTRPSEPPTVFRDFVLKVDPGAFLPLVIHGQACQDRKEAARVLKRALTVRPWAHVARASYAVALTRLGRDADALKHFRKAVELNPRHNTNDKYNAAVHELKMQNKRRADALFDQCLEEDPNLVFDRSVKIAEIWRREGRAQGAIDLLQLAIASVQKANMSRPPGEGRQTGAKSATHAVEL